MGLAFSVPDRVKIPSSLVNIFKELKLEFTNYEIHKSGNLIKWVKNEKILLLNTALTVEHGKSNSYQKIWREITDEVIKHISDKHISDNHPQTIFLLLGNNAKSKIKFIDIKKHYIVVCVHPSPLSATRGFFNSGVFSEINQILEISNKGKIKW